MRKLTLVAAAKLVAVGLLLTPALSQAKNLEDLLVEKGVITKSEARASGHTGGSKVYWNKGTRLDFADTGFTAKIITEIQTRYEFTDYDEDDTANPDNASSFEVNRARLGVSGTALHEEFDYMVSFEFGSNQRDGASTPELKDAYLQWNICDWGNIRMGQHKPVYSRSQLQSAASMQFADRSIASDIFSFDRNQGATLAMGLNEDWEASAAIFNGNSTGEGINSPLGGVDTKHMGVIGIRGDLMGEMDATVEGDVEHTEDVAVNWGATVLFASQTMAGGGDTDIFAFSTDINIKSEGLSFHGEFFYDENDPDLATSETETIGGYAQLGYFFEPKTWEGAIRYSYVDCDEGAATGNGLNANSALCAGSDDVSSADVSVNYYWWKHHLKAQLGYSLINQDQLSGGGGTSDLNTNRWIFQLSSWF